MSEPAPKSEVLATLVPSPARRWMGVGSSALLSLIILWIASVPQPNPLWQLVFFVAGLWVLWGAYRMYRATVGTIVLTREALVTGTDEVIARVDNVAKVDRGVFAFKPSNGFLVRLKSAEHAAAWRPGLWWRRGTYVGVGGVVPGGQARAMAEILTALTLDELPDDFRGNL